jgi:type I restriction enzyme R subunit
MKFTEDKLERAFCELLEQEGYPHCCCKDAMKSGDAINRVSTIRRQPDEVLIERDLHDFLSKRYRNESITDTEIKTILLELKSLPSSDLYESNKRFMKMLADGFILKREDRNQKDIYIQLIHYAGLEQYNYDKNDLITILADNETEYEIEDRNIYRFVTQMEIQGSEKRIPDGILYINGLPLVVFEFKSAIREDATIFHAYEQTDCPIRTRYSRTV